MKKLSLRKISNTDWIYNFFVTEKRIYFINSFFKDKISYLCYIEKKHFIENLKNKNNDFRSFLYPPFIFEDAIYSSTTDVNLLETNDYEIINIFEFNNIDYYQYIKDNIVYTKSIDIDDNIFGGYHNSIIKIFNEKIYILNDKKELRILNNHLIEQDKIIKIKIDNFVEIKQNLILLSNDSIYFYNEKELIEIETDNYTKNIFVINDGNFLISNYDKNETIICNINTLENNVLFEFSLLKTAIVNDSILLYKIIADDNLGIIQ